MSVIFRVTVCKAESDTVLAESSQPENAARIASEYSGPEMVLVETFQGCEFLDRVAYRYGVQYNSMKDARNAKPVTKH